MLLNANYLLKRRVMQKFYLLPLFYALPQPLVFARNQHTFPRNPWTVTTTPKWRNLYNSVGWQAEVADMWALTIWPYLGIRGGFSTYSYNDPFVRLVCALPIWVAIIEAIGISRDHFATFPDDAEVTYFSEEQTDLLCKGAAKMFWHDPYVKTQQLWDIIKEHRDFADYSDRVSKERIDFHRRYYHTRTKIKVVPLHETQEEVSYIPEMHDYLEYVELKDWVNKFFFWLGNKNDKLICKYLYMGATQQQIAGKLGYKNHSGVTKRVAYIRDILEAFIEWQRDLERDRRAAPPEKLLGKKKWPGAEGQPEEQPIKYDLIDFQYKRKNTCSG